MATAYYKVQITYKNPEWIDTISTLADMEYFQTLDIVLNPPPGKELDAVQQHAAAQQTIAAFWGGQAPLMLSNTETFIHPNRIIKIEILSHIEVATSNADAIARGIATGA